MNKYSGWWMVAVWLFILPVSLSAQVNKNTGNAVPLFSIHNNQAFDLAKFHTGLRAIVFLSPDCPLSQNYTLTLNRLQHEYSGKLTVMGIFLGPVINDSACLAFEEKYRVTFTLLKDQGKLLATKLGATITPQVFLMNSSGHVVYSGAIDNWVVTLGKKRRVASEHYLKDAIEHALAGLPARPHITRAVGCFIN